MSGGEGGGNARELDRTPTWAVASVCAVIVLISILLEKGLHHLGEWFTERRKKAMFEALEKIKGELMVLGFISLLLTFGQNYIVQICIPEEAADTMLPCDKEEKVEPEEGEGVTHHRRLLWDSISKIPSKHRLLMEASSSPHCSEGKVPIISLNGLHQLHIFIFFLAIFHVLISAVTMALGREKIRSWKEWEKETTSPDYQFSNDPARFRFSHETSFVREHTSLWNRIPAVFYIVSFFRQFFRSVRKADYLSMRHGFITVHLAPGSQFDFQKYIKRAMEDDFKVIVGISPILWASAVIFLLLNAIITQMALEIKERHAVIQGIPLVQLSDQHFWFGRPRFILFLIHFTLFQNAFQLIYLLWIWYEYGWNSCFHDDDRLMIARVCLGIIVQVLCSYITLPLYALVSQMGSQMKKSIFDEHTSKAIMKWHQAVKKKNPNPNPNPNPKGSPNGSPKAAAVHPTVHHLKSAGDIQLVAGQSGEGTKDLVAEAPVPAAAATQTSAQPPADLLTGLSEQPVRAVEKEKGKGKGDEFQLVDLSDT
ncbi:MLO-like protein 9 [Canna indica]|uniref:MLO-like protein n=1 Tax=Canna indica TaxID=4628 RepID=A0AAQ3KYQ6_9LILI|nr:MLO-like protein 9 [Canna indica]